jgi:glyoxylate utilization-related uncharacterized protein
MLRPGNALADFTVNPRVFFISALAFVVGLFASFIAVALIDALVQILEGAVDITIAGKPDKLEGGDMILMPAQQPHALKALQPSKIILTMIRS